jgi:hypothetical protein
MLKPTGFSMWRAHAPSTASAFLVEQGYGVRDARDEPAQAGEQQQFFDLPDHDVLPGEGPGDSNEERELGFHARAGFASEVGNSTRLSRRSQVRSRGKPERLLMLRLPPLKRGKGGIIPNA